MHDVRATLAARLPGVRVDSVTPLGAGLDNTAYLVNGDLMVRFAGSDRAGTVEREAGLLRVVAAVSPVAVPEPVFAADGCMAYPLLGGVPLLLSRAAPAGVAATLGGLLAAVHAVPAAAVAAFVDAETGPLSVWLSEAAAVLPVVEPHVPAAVAASITAFTAAAPPEPARSLVLAHNDLGSEHVLIADGRVSGVVDWTDAALTDPARDFGLILRDLGPAALDEALRAHGKAPDGLVERAWFFARCGALEDLAYGMADGHEPYAAKSLAALPWLFAG